MVFFVDLDGMGIDFQKCVNATLSYGMDDSLLTQALLLIL